MTYRQFVDYLKQRQRFRALEMKQPDDEWWPEAHFALPAQTRTVRIDPSYFRDRLSKRFLVNEVIVPVIRAGRVRMFGLQLVMYMLNSKNPAAQGIIDRPEYDPVGVPNFADVPGRIEVVGVTVWDAERTESWTAEIARPESGPPTLGVWQMATVGSLWGPMFDPITAAMR